MGIDGYLLKFQGGNIVNINVSGEGLLSLRTKRGGGLKEILGAKPPQPPPSSTPPPTSTNADGVVLRVRRIALYACDVRVRSAYFLCPLSAFIILYNTYATIMTIIHVYTGPAVQPGN